MASLSLINTMTLPSVKQLNTNAILPKLDPLTFHQPGKWTYLIANSIQVKQATDHFIRLNKPEDDKVFEWVEKLVCGKQCSSIFVENLDVNDSRFAHIKFLCKMYKVILINLTTEENLPDNVVLGPWH